ncbi:MAG: hypothetical protein A2Y73_02135 [Chloroflexi bacterium RBG_13_56_8]|nr:MAG: hypothetical protein A2Y73_02135 [Chloroflexi bacterium RBG_13_56_8]
MYDLLIKNGQVIDPAANLSGKWDIAIGGTQIVRIAPGIEETEARRVLDVAGKIVAPGLIDLHAHVNYGVGTPDINENNAPPDLVGVQSGVTTLVDGGSTGSHTFGGFVRYVMPTARTRIVAFLNLCRTGWLAQPAMTTRDAVDLESTIRTIQAYKPTIAGIKLSLWGPVLDVFGIEAMRMAVRATRETGTRLMIHIGDLGNPPHPRVADFTREALTMMDAGDILLHMCTAKPGGILDAEGKVIPELLAAKSRGVILDSAQGRTNFSFEVTRRLRDQGVVPDTISSDVTLGGRTWIVYSLTECMAKFLALGFTLEDTIRMTTSNPARALGMSDALGTIATGREADLSILEVVEGDWKLTDSFGQSLQTEKAIVPVVTVRAGEMIMPDWGPHPWGWLPARA